MKRISAVWICLLLLTSSAFLFINVREDVKGKTLDIELMNTSLVHNVDTNEYFNTIQAAINDADTLNGHTIEANASTYNENVVVNKKLTIIGEDKNTTFIDGRKIGQTIRVISDWVSITGFSIINSSKAIYIESMNNEIYLNNISYGLSGITLDTSADYNNILNNCFYKNREHCIIVNSGNNTITNNYLNDNGGNIGDGSFYPCIDLGQAYYNNISFNVIYTEVVDGIALYYSPWNNIYGNYIHHTNDTYGFRGISLARYSDYNTITYNTINNTPDYGILLWLDATSVNISHNTFNNCNIAILYSQYHNSIPKDIIISNNHIFNTRDRAIIVQHYSNVVRDASITGNVIHGGHMGIYITGVWDSTIHDNKIENCDYGIYIECFSMSENIMFQRNQISNCTSYGLYNEGEAPFNANYCYFYHNYFVNNSIHACDNGTDNQWDNGYPDGGNYWSDYNGIDIFSGPGQNISGSDGLGDTPYTKIQGSGGFQDNYPLMHSTNSNPTTYNVSLSEGWNLISLPLIQNYESIHQVLDSITGKWDYIQIYDALDPDHWKTNATFKPDQLNDLKTLNHKIGFWINITEPNVNLTVHGYESEMASILLYAGWNLVGYPTLNSTVMIADALWGTGADKVEVFDPVEPYRIREVGPTYVMKPGEGYWVHVPVDTIWIVDW